MGGGAATMILPTTNWPPAVNHRDCRQRGFTLVEIILVMALLTITVGVAYPALSGFFRGRNLDAEARRFLALTRYAQSQAISLGVPMELWIDVDLGTYGLEPYPGYVEATETVLLYELEDDLQLELPTGRVSLAGFGSAFGTASGSAMGSQYGTAIGTQSTWSSSANSQPAIGFRPDGTLIETSPIQVVLRDRDNAELWIVQSQTGLNYEIIRPPKL